LKKTAPDILRWQISFCDPKTGETHTVELRQLSVMLKTMEFMADGKEEPEEYRWRANRVLSTILGFQIPA